MSRFTHSPLNPRCLAVVPAYNEAATVGQRRRARCTARRPSSTCSSSTTARPTPPPTSRRAGRRPRAAPAVQPRHRRRRAGRLHVRARARLRLHGPGRRRRPARPRRDRRRSIAAMAQTPTSTWSAARASSTDDRLPRADQPPHRASTSSPSCCRASSRQPVTRPDLGLPALQPPRDRAVRPRLPARLPRGRGGADAPPPPPADARGAGADVPARRRRVVDRSGKSVYYMIKVLLALFVGLARAPAGPRARRRGAGRRGARDLMETRIQIVAIVGAARAAADRARAGPPPAAARALRAAVAVQRVVLLGLAVWRGALEQVASAVGIDYPPNALFFVAFGFILRAAAALLGRGLAPGRPEQGARPAPRDPRAARARACGCAPGTASSPTTSPASPPRRQPSPASGASRARWSGRRLRDDAQELVLGGVRAPWKREQRDHLLDLRRGHQRTYRSGRLGVGDGRERLGVHDL